MLRSATATLAEVDRAYGTKFSAAQSADLRIRVFCVYSIAQAFHVPPTRIVAMIRDHYAFQSHAGLGLTLEQLTNGRVLRSVVTRMLQSGTLEAQLPSAPDFADVLYSGVAPDDAHRQYQQSVQASIAARLALQQKISKALESWSE
jgi:hypothetical protein